MLRSIFVNLGLSVALACGAASVAQAKGADKAAKPPPGIGRTTATLAQILRQHTSALGGLEHGTPDSRQESWQIDDDGLIGRETLTRHGLDYFAHIERGPFVEEYGQLEGRRWHRGPNGTVSPVQSVDYESFAMLRVLEDAADPKNDVKLLGEVAAPKAAYVIEVRFPGVTQPEWVFYDKSTGFIIRVETTIRGEQFVSTYDDYVATRGLYEPTHIHDAVPSLGLAMDYVRKALDFGVAFASQQFQMPTGKFLPGTHEGHVALPSALKDGTLIVRVTVGGRGLDFELSLGSPESLIDRDVARELKLPSFGQRTQSGKDALSYETRIADATIGTYALHNFAVRAVEYNYEAYPGTKVVGLLGFDFLRDTVAKLDFYNGTVQLLSHEELDALPQKAYLLRPQFDDGMPYLKGTIDGHETDNILVDNSWISSGVVGSFVRAHPESVPDPKGRQHATSIVPFADVTSRGHAIEIWQTKLPSFYFGTFRFVNQAMFATNGDLPSDHDIDAILGYDMLAFYDVYLDYPRDQMFLVPNAWFAKYFKINPPDSAK